MQLKYHQATLDMLTSEPIDPQPYLDFLRFLWECCPEEGGVPQPPPAWTTLSLFHYEPRIDNATVELMDTFEARFKAKIPDSIREWFSLDIGRPVLEANDAWYPLDIEEWDNHLWDEWDNNIILAEGILQFMHESQSGHWCVKLNEGDDPPIYWIESNSPDLHLRQDAPRFSDFVYCFLWDWFMNYKSLYGFTVHSVEDEHVPEILRLKPQYHVSLDHLQTQFREVPQRWLSRRRFYTETQRFFMYSPLNNEQMLSGGEFYADSGEALADLVKRIWGENPPLEKMETQHYPRNRPASEQLLDSLKQKNS